MPGQTNNDIVIAALNELILAINEIVTTLPPGTDLTTVENNLGLLAGFTDDIRVAIETEGVAAITAQNTNFSDLVGTLGMLKLICCQTINVSPQNYFQPLQPTSDPGGEGIPAPEPFIELQYGESAIADRKCWVSNVIVDEMRSFHQHADDWQLDEITNISYAALFLELVAFLGAWAAEAIVYAEIASTVNGLLSVLAKYALDNIGGLEFSEIVIAIDNRRDDLVCAIFEAQDVNTARSDFVAILNEEAVSAINKTWVIVVLDDFYLNYAFYQFSEQVEAAYQLATGYDCDGCSVVCGVWVPSANTILSDDGTTIEVDGVQNRIQFGDTSYYMDIYFSATDDPIPCAETFILSNVAITSGVASGAGPVTYRVYSGTIQTVGDLYHSNQIPASPINGVKAFVVKSLQPFTVQMDRVQE